MKRLSRIHVLKTQQQKRGNMNGPFLFLQATIYWFQKERKRMTQISSLKCNLIT